MDAVESLVAGPVALWPRVAALADAAAGLRLAGAALLAVAQVLTVAPVFPALADGLAPDACKEKKEEKENNFR